MAWCRQAPSHYLSRCWPRSKSPCNISRPQSIAYSIYEYTRRYDKQTQTYFEAVSDANTYMPGNGTSTSCPPLSGNLHQCQPDRYPLSLGLLCIHTTRGHCQPSHSRQGHWVMYNAPMWREPRSSHNYQQRTPTPTDPGDRTTTVEVPRTPRTMISVTSPLQCYYKVCHQLQMVATVL